LAQQATEIEEDEEKVAIEDEEDIVKQSDVIVLTDENFEEMVFGSDEDWFIEFYAPWCGHCKALQPEWEVLGTLLKGKINVGKVDATE